MLLYRDALYRCIKFLLSIGCQYWVLVFTIGSLSINGFTVYNVQCSVYMYSGAWIADAQNKYTFVHLIIEVSTVLGSIMYYSNTLYAIVASWSVHYFKCHLQRLHCIHKIILQSVIKLSLSLLVAVLWDRAAQGHTREEQDQPREFPVLLIPLQTVIFNRKQSTKL